MSGSPYTLKDFPGSSHRLVLEALAGMQAGRILDLGAADGYLAGLLRGKGHHVTGVEIDAVAAERARAHCDELIVRDLDREPPPPGPFDAIVAADVLEHLKDPDGALVAILDRLAPAGRAVVSVPNVANFTVRAALAAGRWNYTERGILDRTHLRFFTRRTFVALIERCGGRLESLRSTAVPLPLALPRWGEHPLMLALQGAVAAVTPLWPGLFAYQFVAVIGDARAAARANPASRQR